MTNAAIVTVDADPYETWLAKRKTLITGTDLAALFGVSRYKKTPMSVWLDKTGRAAEKLDRQALEFGRLFEQPILQAYAKRDNVTLSYPGQFQLLTVPEFPWLGATLDGVHASGDKIGMPVDAKNLWIKSPEFGEDRSDVMPLAFALQLTAQMIVSKTDHAALAVLFNRYEFNTFYCQRDPVVVERIAERTETFMTKHVRADTPPVIDGSEAWSDWLGTHHKQKSKDMRSASAIDKENAVKLHAQIDLIKTLELGAEAIRNQFKEIIGDAYGMEPEDESWRITWSQSKDRLVTDYEAVATEYQKTLLALNEQILNSPMGEDDRRPLLDYIAGTLAATLLNHTTTKPGSRSFRFSFKEE
jgi:putative phage-type endonuclease